MKETELVEQGEQIAKTQKKPRWMQQFKEDLEKNPPSAPSPEFIKDLFTTPKGGRPPRFTSCQELEQLIGEYFSSKIVPVVDDETDVVIGYKWRERITLGGLALWLHMGRSTLCEYAQSGEFAETIKKAKNIVESYNENALLDNRNPAGICFIMKNGFGWRDIQEYKVEPVNPLGDQPTPEELQRRIEGSVVCDED